MRLTLGTFAREMKSVYSSFQWSGRDSYREWEGEGSHSKLLPVISSVLCVCRKFAYFVELQPRRLKHFAYCIVESQKLSDFSPVRVFRECERERERERVSFVPVSTETWQFCGVLCAWHMNKVAQGILDWIRVFGFGFFGFGFSSIKGRHGVRGVACLQDI